MSVNIQNTTDPLEPDRLPSDPRTAAMMLLGMTLSEMKEVDNNIVGKKSSLSSLSDTNSVNKMIQEISTLNAVPVQVIKTQPVSQPAPVHQQQGVSPTTGAPAPVYDPNQLEFDFYKKLKPEDIEKHLTKLNDKIVKLDIKIDEILELIKKKK